MGKDIIDGKAEVPGTATNTVRSGPALEIVEAVRLRDEAPFGALTKTTSTDRGQPGGSERP